MSTQSPLKRSCRSAVITVDGIQQVGPTGIPDIRSDELSVEEPLEIRVNAHSVSITMRTPGNDEELAAGFLLTEGLINSHVDLQEIGPCSTISSQKEGSGNRINVTLAEGVETDFSKLTRHVFASSSCGLCGKASIANIQTQFPPLDPAVDEGRIELQVLRNLVAQLRQAQENFARTGGLHAAGIFDFRGRRQVVREDVGRHNAVDKVIGYTMLNKLPLWTEHILLVSGRASFEIIQKAIAARVPVVAAVSAPSSLAVEFARKNGQTLIGFLRDQSLNIYTHPGRVLCQK